MIELLKKYGFAPRSAVWELTLRCNLRCRHCGSRAGEARADEMTLGECLKVANELADMGCRFVTLGGGEPLMRKDWPLIAQALIQRGVTVGMVSNGTLWTEEVARTFKTIGLESVAFSIDGDEEKHDRMRRCPGLYQRILKAIALCQSHGIVTSVVTTVTSENLHDLETMRETLRGLGIQRWQVQFGTATGNMADNLDLVIQPEDVLVAVPMIAKMCKDKKLPAVFPAHDIGYYGEHEESLRHRDKMLPYWTGCSAGCSVIGIESNGNIKGCLSLPSMLNGEEAFVEGNVRKRPLRAIWNDENAFAYNRKFSKDQLGGFCHSCEYAEVCRGGCVWTTYANDKLVRDNPYCYWRQLQTREQGAAHESVAKHLPIAD